MLTDCHASADADPSEESRIVFTRSLRDANEVTRRIIEFLILERCGYEPRLGSGKYAVARNEFEELGRVIEDAKAIVSTNLKPGKAEPAMEQMARGLAGLYLTATGELPKRSYRVIPPKGDETLHGNCGDFNTATSMGRLTLNVLLSFAQFEREVTAERIRDKIAASKKKGLWMGGLVPLGYDAKDHTLVVNETEAETVRTIFQLYLEFGCVRRVKEEVDRRGLVSKHRQFESGKAYGGVAFTRGRIYHLLSNPV